MLGDPGPKHQSISDHPSLLTVALVSPSVTQRISIARAGGRENVRVAFSWLVYHAPLPRVKQSLWKEMEKTSLGLDRCTLA